MKIKRLISALIIISMVLQMFCIFPASAEVGSKLYEYDGYSVEYSITNEWDGGQTTVVKITNTGDESILNWTLKCNIEGEISNLWNAEIYERNETTYIFKNCGWNYEIRQNESVTFGYTLSGDNFSAPDSFTSCSERKTLTLGYSVDMNITSTWDTGVQGEITIANTSDEPLEAWCLSFDSSFTMDNIWDVRVLSNDDNHYVLASESWRNPIGVGETLTIGFVGIVPPETPIEISNVSLSVVVIEENAGETSIFDKLIISAYGGYVPETETIDIVWLSTIPKGVFDVVTSEDNSDYTVVGSVTDADSYSLPVQSAQKYIKVRQTAGSQIAESEPLVLTKTENGYVVDYIDTDGDGLYDYIENAIGTDKDAPDSDNDGLSDYEEMLLTNSDPVVYNSINERLSDSEADSDSDGLSNITEIELGTNPLNPDSDGDGLTDGDEVSEYLTNPLDDDTDEDGADDGWETENGYDPLVFNELFNVTETAVGENISVSVDVKLSGAQAETLEIKEVSESPFLNETIPGYIGSAFDFTVDGNIEEATIKFTFDEALLGEDFKPVIYYFNEETQLLEELETTAEGNTASAKTTHFSQYILLNQFQYNDSEIIIRGTLENMSSDVVFVIDYSYSMEWNDPTFIRRELTKKFISDMPDGDRAAVIIFYTNRYVLCELTDNKNDLISALDTRTYCYSGTNGSYAINDAISILNDSTSLNKSIVFLTDGGDTEKGCSYDDLIAMANENDIKIYTIALGSANEELLKQIASETSAKFYKAGADTDLSEIYSSIEDETINRDLDSNNDGISDYYTKMLCDNTIHMGTGAENCFVGLSYDEINADTDGDYDNDGLKNGEEMHVEIDEETGKVYIRMTSYPTKEDSDGDGLKDDIDEIRLKKFDDRFIIVDNFNYYPSIDFMDYSKLGTGLTEFNPNFGTVGEDGRNNCYDSKEPELENFVDYFFLSSIALAGVIPNFSYLGGLLVYDELRYMGHAGLFLYHFLENNGNTYELSRNQMVNIIITEHRNLAHFKNNINSIRKLGESTVVDGGNLFFSSNTNNNFRIACYDSLSCEEAHDIKIDKGVAGSDWSYAIGESLCGMVAEIKRTNDIYNAEIKYCLMDYYEWGYHAEGNDYNQHMLHECGLAKEFPIYGELIISVSWKKGEQISCSSEIIDMLSR